MALSSLRILHFHFKRSALFISLTSLTPKPPFTFGLQTTSHFTQWILLFSTLPLQRNSLWIFRISLTTSPGALKKERVKIGIEFNTEFKRVTLPPIEMFLPFHEESHLFKLFNKSNQTFFLLGLSPTKIPKNLKGYAPFLQERKVVAALMYHSPTFTPIILLLAKLIFKPDTNSNPLKITFKFQRFSQF